MRSSPRSLTSSISSAWANGLIKSARSTPVLKRMNAPIFFWQLNMFRRDFLTCYGRMQAMTLAALQCFERRSFFSDPVRQDLGAQLNYGDLSLRFVNGQ